MPISIYYYSQPLYFSANQIYNGTEKLFTWQEARDVCKRLHPHADLMEIHDEDTQGRVGDFLD